MLRLRTRGTTALSLALVILAGVVASCDNGAAPTSPTPLPTGGSVIAPPTDVAQATGVLPTQEAIPQPTTEATGETTAQEAPTQLSTPAPLPTTNAGAIPQPLPAGPLTIVALGDSLTEGDGDDPGGRGGYPGRLGEMMNTLRPASRVINLGKSGWDSGQLLAEQLPAALQSTPHIALVWIGSNDLWYNNALEQEEWDLGNYTINIDATLRALRGAGALTFIALLDDQSLRPFARNPDGGNITAAGLARMSRRVRAYNEAITAKAAEHGAITVDFFNTTIFTNQATLSYDGNHPNPSGYEIIARIWFDAIRSQLQPVAQLPPVDPPTPQPPMSHATATSGVVPTAIALNPSQPGDPGGPRLFFSDIESGPNSGGQDNLGVFITLWGEGFGVNRGDSTVTIGGQEVAKYIIWGEDNAFARELDMIVVQLGGNARTGNISVTVNGKASNSLPFTVRDGQIYFVAPGAGNADDSNPGTFDEPFKTPYKARDFLKAGDIVYIRGGTLSEMDPTGPGWDAILMLDPDTGAATGTPDRPVAYIGYPGESPVLGNLAARRGILTLTSDLAQSYYIIANLTFVASMNPISLSGVGHRVIGNYLHDSALDDSGALSINTDSSQIKVLGNLLSNNGTPGEKLRGHAFYIGGYGTNSDIEFGWNQIQNQEGGRSIQLYGHLANDRIEDIRIHDNLLSGAELNNVVLGGSDGGTEVLGTIYVYNNIIEGSGEPGLRVNDPQGTVYVQNNTFYDNSTAQIYLERAGNRRVTVQNNILYARSDQLYYSLEEWGAQSSSLNASNNLCFGAGDCPDWDSNSLSADPALLDIETGNYRPGANSPAIDAGADTNMQLDYLGYPRPQGKGFDIGAYESETP